MLRREKMKFEGVEKMPNYWKPYFSMSKIGNEYEVLYEVEDKGGKGENLIMSDTEYEYYTNQPFLQKVKNGDEILSIGYGIGLIIPEVKKRGGKLTIVEKYQEVLDLEPELDTDVGIILGDINVLDIERTFPKQRFDIIFSDISEVHENIKSLEAILKPNGELITWKHLSVYNLNN